MTLSKSITVAAPKAAPDPNATKLSRYSTRIDFPVKDAKSNAPFLLQKLLAALTDKFPRILFYTAADEKIDIEDFPKEKSKFDKTFKTTITENRNPKIIVGLEIRSDQPFHSLKTSIWSFLQKHHIFLKKHNGPLTSMDIVTVGWAHKLHPTFTSHENIRTQIFGAFHSKMSDMTSSEQAQLADFQKEDVPDFFLSSGRLNGTYENDSISSNVLLIQAERSTAKLLRTLLEMTFKDTSTILEYIPISLKYDNPSLFGKILSYQNEYLDNHRNVAIAGLCVDAMDHRDVYDDYSNETSLWSFLLQVPGVIRLDSCKRTADIGKWNLSTTKEDYIQVTTWVDENLPGIYLKLPIHLQDRSSTDDFPNPRRLSRSPRKSQASTSPSTSEYNQSLANRMNATPAVANIQRTAWRPFKPVSDVYYDFDAVDFPPMQKRLDNDAKSATSITQMSSISEQLIKDTIASETAKMISESRKRELQLANKIEQIENSISAMTASIVSQIFSKLTGADSPFVTVIQLEASLDRITRQLEHLTRTSSPTPGSPTRKQARLCGPDVMAIDGDPPPDSS
jgi:hypothetical protein